MHNIAQVPKVHCKVFKHEIFLNCRKLKNFLCLPINQRIKPLYLSMLLDSNLPIVITVHYLTLVHLFIIKRKSFNVKKKKTVRVGTITKSVHVKKNIRNYTKRTIINVVVIKYIRNK